MKYDGTLKRAFDIAVGAVCTASLAVPVLGVAFAKWVYHRENPFFFDKRVGKDGKLFTMIKLKSMRTAFDKEGKLLPDEQRRTWFGSILKHTAFDEFPQFINVLKGDMSLVGPRPLSQEEMDLIPDRYKVDIQKIRPGITGPWQISAIGRKTSFKERFIHDATYVRNGITFKRDLYYMFRTVPAFILGHDK